MSASEGSLDSEATLDKMMLLDKATKGLVIN